MHARTPAHHSRHAKTTRARTRAHAHAPCPLKRAILALLPHATASDVLHRGDGRLTRHLAHCLALQAWKEWRKSTTESPGAAADAALSGTVAAVVRIQGPVYDYVVDVKAMTHTNSKTKVARKILRLADEQGAMVNLRHTVVSPTEAAADKGFPCGTCGKVYADMIVAELCRRKGCKQRKAKRGRKKRQAGGDAAAAAAAAAAAGCCGDGSSIGRWKEAKTAGGKLYYYNTVTKESRWDNPAAAASTAVVGGGGSGGGGAAGSGGDAPDAAAAASTPGANSSGGDIILAWVAHSLRRAQSTPSYTALKGETLERFGADLWNSHKGEIQAMLMRADGVDPATAPPPAPVEELYGAAGDSDEGGEGEAAWDVCYLCACAFLLCILI